MGTRKKWFSVNLSNGDNIGTCTAQTGEELEKQIIKMCEYYFNGSVKLSKIYDEENKMYSHNFLDINRFLFCRKNNVAVEIANRFSDEVIERDLLIRETKLYK